MITDVVIADGDTILAAAYESFLVVEGFHVKIVNTGIECLKQLRNDPPRLLVIDPNMHWGGLGILEMLCEGEDQLDIPVIVLMEEPSQEQFRFIPHRASAVILKPFAPSSMAKLVQQLTPPNRHQFRLKHLVKGISSLRRTPERNNTPLRLRHSLANN